MIYATQNMLVLTNIVEYTGCPAKQYFGNISFHISPNNKELDISKIYTKWAVKKCPIWNF